VGRELRRLGVQRRIVSQPRAKTGWDSLTDSELTVVNLIAQGVTNQSVATQLHLSLYTVKNHVNNAFTQLGHQLPHPASAAHARVRLTSHADNGMAEALG
jgi:DNA-binding CsgD family transcriptional regulator